MLVRIRCKRCRLGALWTDDPDGFLAVVCGSHDKCEAKLFDEAFDGLAREDRRRAPRLMVRGTVLLKPLRRVGIATHAPSVDVSPGGIKIRVHGHDLRGRLFQVFLETAGVQTECGVGSVRWRHRSAEAVEMGLELREITSRYRGLIRRLGLR